MKKKKIIGGILAGALLCSCAGLFGMLDYRKPETFEDKTGVIGVLRLPDDPCRGWDGSGAGYLKFGTEDFYVIPDESNRTDALFAAYLDPGNKKLHKYTYSCSRTYGRGENARREVQQYVIKPEDRVSIKIPADGFCKIILSLRHGRITMGEDDDFLRDFFEEQGVALEFDDVPYCKHKISETVGQ